MHALVNVREPALKIGYVLKRFPRLSETFILNEILELERQGVKVEIFSLLRPPNEPRHAFLQSLGARVTCLPRTSALERWKIYGVDASGGLDEDLHPSPMEEWGGDTASALGALFPGKSSQESALLQLQALSVAMLASSRGVCHLHAHFASNATTVAMLASRLSRIPFSFTAHARDIYHTYVDGATDDRLRRLKIADAAFVVTVSDYNRAHLSNLAQGCASTRIERIYNGVDLSRFHPANRKRAACRLLAVGRLVEKKGFSDLIEACRLLDADGHRFECVIVGEGPDRNALLAQIRRAGLETRVELVGAMTQERLLQLLREATAFVLPCVVSESGDRDGLPTVLLEALALGLPAISTRVAGIPEIIDDEHSGLLVAPRDAPALARAVHRLLIEPELRERLGKAARHQAERLFNLSTNVAALRHLFEQTRGKDLHDSGALPHAHRLRIG